MPKRIHKKNLIVSYNNLSEELKELFKESYPDGYKEYLQKTIKPNGEPIFVVPIETEDSVYMVKFDVKIDTGLVEEDLDKDLYGEEKTDEGDFAPISEAIDKEEGESHAVGTLKHGAYEEIFDNNNAKKEFEVATADIEAEFGTQDDDDYDNYVDEDSDSDKDDTDEDTEPDDEDLLNLEKDDFLAEVLSDDSLTTELEKKCGHSKSKGKEVQSDSKGSPAKVARETKTRRIRKNARGEK